MSLSGNLKQGNIEINITLNINIGKLFTEILCYHHMNVDLELCIALSISEGRILPAWVMNFYDKVTFAKLKRYFYS